MRLRFLDARHFRAGVDVDAFPLHEKLDVADDLHVFSRQNRWEEFQHGNAAAERVKNGGKLASRNAAADDNEAFREFAQVQDTCRCQHLCLVNLKNRRFGWF